MNAWWTAAQTARAFGLLIGLAPHASAQCLDWSDAFHAPGVKGFWYEGVLASIVFDDGGGGGPALYVGGDFTSAGKLLTTGIVRWTGSSFEALGSGLNGQVSAFAVYDEGNGPVLFLAGGIKTAGGVPAANIARWDGSTFSAVGGGTGGVIEALAVYDEGLGAGPVLFAGGYFASAGGQPALHLARWDGVSWSDVGGGLGGSSAHVSCMAVYDDGSGPALYVGGKFDTAGALPVHNLARWDGVSWSDLGGGISGAWPSVAAIVVHNDGSGPALYVGGDFHTAGSTQASHVARWNGRAWSPLGRGTDAPVQSLYVHDDGSGPALYVGGSFSSAGGRPANGVARWSAAGWSPLGAGVHTSYNGGARCFATVDLGGPGLPPLFVGGGFLAAGDEVSWNVALWDGSDWSSLVSGAGVHPQGGGINAIVGYDDGNGPDLYACGGLWASGPTLMEESAVALWDGATWTALPPTPGWVPGNPLDMAVFDPGTGPGLYVSWSGSGVRMWNGSAWDPSQTIGTDGIVSDSTPALVVHDDGSGLALYAGGAWDRAYVGPSWVGPFLLRWDGTVLSNVGQAPGPVTALLSLDDGSGPALYAGFGSNFGWPNGTPKFVSRWDGASWTQLGGDLTSLVSALVGFDDGSGPAVYAASAPGVLRWDGVSWVPIGSGAVKALAAHDDGSGPALYAAGSFTAMGQVPASGVARWTGAGWDALGLGIDAGIPGAEVRTLASLDDGSGPRLWAGGRFLAAGGRPSLGIARWGDDCGCTGTTYCTSKTSSLGCVPSMALSGITNLTATQPFVLSATQVLSNKYGLLFYGTSGADAKPLVGGTLCVRAPIRRTPVQWSGGNPPPEDCSGSFALDFKAYALSGTDPALVAGTSVCAQYWYRDPGDPFGSSLTDAAAFTLCP